jgi:phosphoribosylaminoimidazolecarboxamide formyltransferase/IMP cyclohydrolase
MTEQKKIKSALISVFSKEGLAPIIRNLNELGVTIFATGGTQEFIEEMGISVVPVEEITSYPSILGGRVKTLHPKVFGGILGRRSNDDDNVQLEEYGIPAIDLVVVDLYPFEKTVSSGASDDDIIEKIDIGGVSLIRAAAKNHRDVVIIPSVEQYSDLSDILAKGGSTTPELRRHLAGKAFEITCGYDNAISGWFNDPVKELRYGENPHQKGRFIGDLESMLEQLHGKELSYNNLLDIDAAVNLASDFKEPVMAILKHNNACGISMGPDPLENWKRALKADPVSAFGGVIISTSMIDEAVAMEMDRLFFEVCIAPSYSDGALSILKKKKNRVILKWDQADLPSSQKRTILNGTLWQERDERVETEADLRNVTELHPDKDQVRDLLFANIVAKHSRSNTIVLAKDNMLLAAGVGQTSRVDALKQAIHKAKSFDFDLHGAVMASDAFFPFPDCVEIARAEGIRAVIQPGGSIKDQDSIDYCNSNSVAMVLTGIRHFKH